jgi:hypothetical protein
MADKFFIAPLDSGLTLDKKPFAIIDSAFTELRNVYSWRGRIVKRFGSELTGTGAINSTFQSMYSKGAIDLSAFPATLGYGIGQTDDTGGFIGNVKNALSSFTGYSAGGFIINQYFSIGTITYTINAMGAPNVLTVSGGGSTASLNTTIGALIVVGALAGETITFYPYVGYPYSGLTDGTGYVTGKVPGNKFKVGQQFSIGDIIFTVITAGVDKPMLRLDPSNLMLTDPLGAAIGTVPAALFRAATLGARFIIGDEIFTVTALGAPAAMTSTGAGIGTFDTVTGDYTIAGSYANEQIAYYPPATFNTTTGAYEIFIPAQFATKVYYYPNDPIMGFAQYEIVPVNDEPAFAFDTQFAYEFSANRWLYSGPGPVTYFHGTDAQFFWSCSYQGVVPGSTIMFVTNFNAIKDGTPSATDDPMWYWDHTQWNIFAPVSIPGAAAVKKTIVQAKIIIPYKNHLLLMDTIEQVNNVNTRYQGRCRFSWLGSPIGLSTNPLGYPWYESGQIGYSGAGWVDAGTQEVINSAEYLKDRLDIGFERSTWELAYTNNETEPFQWNKLNTELGSESPFSTVPFDKQILSVGIYGITGCNGQNVERIDNDIPDYVFDVNTNSSGTYRIHGIRDYKTEMVYWTMPIQNKTKWSYFPNRVLVYNYRSGAWSENDDCITAFGYFEQSADKTWADMTIPWEECTFSWNSYVAMAKDRMILAGNQQGFISLLNPTLTSNARVNAITNFVFNPVNDICTLTIMNHTMFAEDYIKLYDINGITIDPADTGIYKISTVVDADTITLNDVGILGGTYIGGGACSRVSRPSMKTKQWNFYLKEGRNFMINKIDFLVKRSSGSLKIEQMPNSTDINLGQDAINTGTALGINPFKISLGGQPGIYMEADQVRLWRTIFPMADANFIQLKIYIDDDMMKIASDVFSEIELNAIVLSCKPTGAIMEDNSNV